MTKKERTEAEGALAAALHRWAAAQARKLVVGAELHGTIPDLTEELEITVRVRHRVALEEEVAAFRKRAVEHLTAKDLDLAFPTREYPHLYLVKHCGCYVQRKGWLGRKHKDDCRGKVVAAVVYRPWTNPGSGEAYLYVCSRHRENHHVAGRDVLAVVELPPAALADARKLWEEQDRKWRAELDREAAEAAKGGTPS